MTSINNVIMIEAWRDTTDPTRPWIVSTIMGDVANTESVHTNRPDAEKAAKQLAKQYGVPWQVEEVAQ